MDDGCDAPNTKMHGETPSAFDPFTVADVLNAKK